MKNTIFGIVCLVMATGWSTTAATAYQIDRAVAGQDRQQLVRQSASTLATGWKNQPCRRTGAGGNFTYTLKVANADLPQMLHVRYSGEEKGTRDGNPLFSILIDGQKLAVQGLDRNLPGTFIDEYYDLPSAWLKNRKTVAVTFAAYDQHSTVGGVYEVEILRAKTEFGNLSDWTCYQGFGPDHSVKLPGTVIYTEPEGPRNGRAAQPVNDSCLNLPEYYGIEMTVDLERVPSAVIRLTAAPQTGADRRSMTVHLDHSGVQTVLLPFAALNSPQADQVALCGTRTLTFQFEGTGGTLKCERIRLLRGLSCAITTPVRSQAVEVSGVAVYPLTVTNTELTRQTITVQPRRYGWETMPVTVTPSVVTLDPGARTEVTVKVTVPELIPPGGRETQQLAVMPSARPAAETVFPLITVRALPHPFALHTAAGWQEVRAKAEKYDWAKKRAAEYVRNAEQWQPPERAVFMLSRDTGRPCLTPTTEEAKLMDTAIAWQMTGNRTFAAKAAKFLLMISHPQNGYPVTRQAGHQASVQEGHFFQHLAQAYDLIHDAGVLTDTERRQIEATLRLFATSALRNTSPAGANWAVSSLTGAFFCALVLQDFYLVDQLLFAPSMLLDKFRSYTMSDGWWYECTVSYNLWCAEEFTQIALALEPFGYALLHRKFPVNTLGFPDFRMGGEREKIISREENYGHSFRIRGRIVSPAIGIQTMSDALLPYLDYRGWMFGINDSTENNVGGGRFELAYYAFRDPRYAAFIKMNPQRTDLLYGVPDLPETPAAIGTGSAYSDNAGLLMLRSTQTEPRERIQAVLKYGTHGGYHGHFDLTALLSLMRYGRSFFNPEMVWYGYGSFMYDFYVQTSVAKNMVVPDFKQQEPAESRRLLFQTGKWLQTGCVETTTMWSNPPYGGLRWTQQGFPTLQAKSEAENRSVTTPANPPRYGELTDFTEPIFQRRLLAVTDQYILLADYLQASQPHDFNLLFQIKGFRNLTASDSCQWQRQTAQLDPDPLKAAQFVTDVNWYRAAGTLKAAFETRFGPQADNAGTRINGEPGVLKMDVYQAWPQTARTAWIGMVPEDHNTQRRIKWNIDGDGRQLAAGSVGAWVLGAPSFDVKLDRIDTLTLTAEVSGRKGHHTVFWGDAAILTADGKRLPLTTLKPGKVTNVVNHRFGADRDYENGKITLAGHVCATGLPAEPANDRQPAVYQFSLAGLKAVRLTGQIGGDYPVGNDTWRRRNLGIRQSGQEAVFLTVIEPYENQASIAGVTASSPNDLTVTLRDGVVHRFHLQKLNDIKAAPELELTVEKDGRIIARESTVTAAGNTKAKTREGK